MFVVTSTTLAPPSWLMAWVALVASLVSLLISVTTFLLTQRRPRVRLLLPNRVRISAARDGTDAFIYVQPIFINSGRSTRAEVVTPVLSISPSGGAASQFEYADRSKTVWDAERREVHVQYVDDAAPIIVGQNSVKSEMLTFRSSRGWQFTPGWYTCTLSAKLSTTNRTLTDSFQFIITDEHRRIWLESDGRRFVMLQTMKSRDATERAG